MKFRHLCVIVCALFFCSSGLAQSVVLDREVTIKAKRTSGGMLDKLSKQKPHFVSGFILESSASGAKIISVAFDTAEREAEVCYGNTCIHALRTWNGFDCSGMIRSVTGNESELLSNSNLSIWETKENFGNVQAPRFDQKLPVVGDAITVSNHIVGKVKEQQASAFTISLPVGFTLESGQVVYSSAGIVGIVTQNTPTIKVLTAARVLELIKDRCAVWVRQPGAKQVDTQILESTFTPKLVIDKEIVTDARERSDLLWNSFVHTLRIDMDNWPDILADLYVVSGNVSGQYTYRFTIGSSNLERYEWIRGACVCQYELHATLGLGDTTLAGALYPDNRYYYVGLGLAPDGKMCHIFRSQNQVPLIRYFMAMNAVLKLKSLGNMGYGSATLYVNPTTKNLHAYEAIIDTFEKHSDWRSHTWVAYYEPKVFDGKAVLVLTQAQERKVSVTGVIYDTSYTYSNYRSFVTDIKIRN